MTLRDEDQPKKAVSHEIGQDISTLSVDELGVRIALLRAEIERLESEAAGKVKGRSAAEDLFRPRKG